MVEQITRSFKAFVVASIAFSSLAEAVNTIQGGDSSAPVEFAQTSQSDCPPGQIQGGLFCECFQPPGSTCTPGTAWNPDPSVCSCAPLCDRSDFDCNLPHRFVDRDDFCGCECPAEKPANVNCGEYGRWDTDVCDCVCDAQSEELAACEGCGCFNFATSICDCNHKAGKPELANCGEHGRWSNESCQCVCDETSVEAANCQASYAFNQATSVCGCICPESAQVCEDPAKPSFNADYCECECGLYANDCFRVEAPLLDEENCLCICDKTGCEPGFELNLQFCACLPVQRQFNCDIFSPAYSPRECEENPNQGHFQLLGCNWFLQAVTDISYPTTDFFNLSNGTKRVDEELCLDEDGQIRPFQKYEVSAPLTPQMFPSSLFTFFRTPFTNEEDLDNGLIYWIQNDLKNEQCPDYSWLTYDDAKCATGETNLNLEALDIGQKRMWKLSKHFGDDSVGERCAFYTIAAWDPEFQEGAVCSTAGYHLDLFDRATATNVGFGSSTVSNQRQVRLLEFDGALAPGEKWCDNEQFQS